MNSTDLDTPEGRKKWLDAYTHMIRGEPFETNIPKYLLTDDVFIELMSEYTKRPYSVDITRDQYDRLISLNPKFKNLFSEASRDTGGYKGYGEETYYKTNPTGQLALKFKSGTIFEIRDTVDISDQVTIFRNDSHEPQMTPLRRDKIITFTTQAAYDRFRNTFSLSKTLKHKKDCPPSFLCFYTS